MAAFSVALATRAIRIEAQPPTIPAIFAFGDANAETGNNNYIQTLLKTNLPPFGETYFHRPNGRVCDGRIVLDFLCQFLGLPFLAPYLEPGANFTYGANFASGGAGALDISDATPARGIPLSQQLSYFQDFRNGNQVLMTQNGSSSQQVPLVQNVSQVTFSEALYYIQIGEVDYAELAILAQEFSLLQVLQSTVQQAVINAIEAALTTLYGLGARKFLIFTVYPLGCMPILLSLSNSTTGSCVPFANQIASDHNAALQELVGGLRSNMTDATMILVRADQVLMDVEQNRRSYGFEDTEAACCGSGLYNGATACDSTNNATIICPNPGQRVYWDQVHCSEAFNRIVAQETWSGGRYTTPINLSTLARLPGLV